MKKIKLLLTIFAIIISITFTTRYVYTTYLTTTVEADELDDINRQKADKEKQLAETLKEINSIYKSKSSISSKISKLEKEVKKLKSLVKDIDKDLDELEDANKRKKQDLIKLQEEIQVQTVKMYLNGEDNVILYLISSGGIKDLLDRMYLLDVEYYLLEQKYTQAKLEIEAIENREKYIKDQREELKATIHKVNTQLKELYAQKQRLDAQLKAKYSTKASLVDEIATLSARARKIIADKAASQSQDPNTGGGGGNTSGGGGTTSPGSGTFNIYFDNGTVIQKNVTGPIRLVLNSTDAYFDVKTGGYKYRGVLEFREDTNVYVINELPMELYIRGLAEMPSSWSLEALKAQAVAGRTYAYAGIGKRSRYHYDLLDNVYDQNYSGVNKEIAYMGSNWVKAVQETKGKVLTVSGNLITTYYHSTCGGHTLSTQEVWGGYRSYAQAVSDRYLSGGIWKGYDSDSSRAYWFAGNKTNTLAYITDLVNAAIYLTKNGSSKTAQNNVACPLDRLNQSTGYCYKTGAKVYTSSKLANILGGDSIQSKVGTITNIQHIYDDGRTTIGEHSKYTKYLKITGTKGSITIDGQVFKLAYNLRAPGSNWIASTLYDVKKINSNNWKIYSRGWGHRVGMCQYGAWGRAKAGQDYATILKHYYTGVTITTKAERTIRIGLTKVGGPVTRVSANASFDIYANGQKIYTVPAGKVIEIAR